MKGTNIEYYIFLAIIYFIPTVCFLFILWRLFNIVVWCIKKYLYREKFPRLKIKAYIFYRKNTKRFVKIFSDILDEYEKELQSEYFSFAPSCKKEMVDLLKYRFSKSRVEISEWSKNDGVDEIKLAYAHISAISFDLLASGEFHIYTGTLDPMSCAFNLKRIHNKVINYALENGYITKEEALEDAEALRQSISRAG